MNMYNPYIQQMPQTQDLGGLSPYFQNIAQQQAMQNMALQQGQGLTNQAGMTVQGKQAGAGMNPMMMAAMLRNQNAGSPYLSSIPAMMKYGSGNVYGGFGQGQTPTDINWDLDSQGM